MLYEWSREIQYEVSKNSPRDIEGHMRCSDDANLCMHKFALKLKVQPFCTIGEVEISRRPKNDCEESLP